MDSVFEGQVRGYELPGRLTTKDSKEVYALGLVSMEKPWKLSDFAFFLAHPASFSFGVREKATGELKSALIALLSDGELDIITFMTHSQHRRLGLARTILENIRANPKVGRITLEVDVSNMAAYRLYHSLGFETDSIRKKYYENKRDAYLMSLIIPRI